MLTSCISKRISVTGLAQNDKGIATLISKKGQYFLKGVHHWDEKYLNKRVKVTGIVQVVKYQKDTVHEQGYSQTRGIDMNYLLKPKWKLAE